MGKTHMTLKILVPAEYRSLEVFRALAEKGHQVDGLPEDGNPWTYDLILGPKCWRMEPLHLKYIELSLKEARKRRYGKKEES